MLNCIALALTVYGGVINHISTSPELRRILHAVCMQRFSKLDKLELANALEKDRIGFATLHIDLAPKSPKPDAATEAIRRDARRRIEAAAAGWSSDRRVDFLVEASVVLGVEDTDLTVKIGLLIIEAVRPVVNKYSPQLLKSFDRTGPPRCEPFGYSERKDPIRVQSAFDDEEFTKSGRSYGGRLIGTLPRLICDDEFRTSLILTRDGIWSKTPKFPRRRLTFDQSIVISNGPVEPDELLSSVVIADAPIRLPSGAALDSCIISNDSIFSQSTMSVPGSTLIARTKIRALAPSETKGSTLIAGDEIDILKAKGGEFGTHIVGKDKFDPGVRFFAVADVGLELKDVDGKAVVKSVAEDSPFRKSLKPGDRINSINDKFFKDFDDCRRVLREACVVGYAFVNRTRDGGHARGLVDLLGYPKPLKAK